MTVRATHFTPIPIPLSRDATVSLKAKGLYAVIRSFSRFGKETGAHPSQKKLCEIAAISNRQFIRLREELRDAGWLKWKVVVASDGSVSHTDYRCYDDPHPRTGAGIPPQDGRGDPRKMDPTHPRATAAVTRVKLQRESLNESAHLRKLRATADAVIDRTHSPRYEHTKVKSSPKRNTFEHAVRWYRGMVEKHLDKDPVISAKWLKQKKSILTKFWPEKRWAEFYRVMEVMIRTWPEWCQKNKQTEAYPPLNWVGTAWWPNWEGWADKHSASTVHSGNPHSFS